MKQFIQFKKQRDLGEILTDTFAFIRAEYKELFIALMRNAGIPFVLLLAASGYYAATTSDTLTLTPGSGMESFGSVFVGLMFMVVAMLLYYGFLFGTVLNYIKSYINRNGAIDQSEISAGTRSSLGSMVLQMILVTIILVIGFMLCFFPGVYLYVPLSLVFALMVFRGLSVGDSISESFRLIKGEWWITFATLLVMGLLISLIQFVFQVPVFIYTIIKGITVSQEISQGDMSSMFDWVYVTLNVLSSAVSYIMYAIMVIATAFIYFNLNEKKYQTGTLEEIDTIGQDS